jgi:hypothetical protein
MTSTTAGARCLAEGHDWGQTGIWQDGKMVVFCTRPDCEMGLRQIGDHDFRAEPGHGMAVGDAGEMQRMAALLKQINVNLADTYAARTAQTPAQLQAWMDDETWMTADTAVQHGFADAITAEQPVSACFGLLQNFRHVPTALRNQRPVDNNPTHRDIAAVRIRQQAQRIAALT